MVQKGIAEANAGLVVPHETATKELNKFFSDVIAAKKSGKFTPFVPSDLHSCEPIKAVLREELHNSLAMKASYEREIAALPRGGQKSQHKRLLSQVNTQIDYLDRLLEVE